MALERPHVTAGVPWLLTMNRSAKEATFWMRGEAAADRTSIRRSMPPAAAMES